MFIFIINNKNYFDKINKNFGEFNKLKMKLQFGN